MKWRLLEYCIFGWYILVNITLVFVHLYFYKNSPMPWNRNIWVWNIKGGIFLGVFLAIIDCSKNRMNLRWLVCIFAFMTIIFLINFIWEFRVGSAC